MAFDILPAEIRCKIFLQIFEWKHDAMLSMLKEYEFDLETVPERVFGPWSPVIMGIVSKTWKDDILAVIEIRKRKLEKDLKQLRVEARAVEAEFQALFAKQDAETDKQKKNEWEQIILDLGNKYYDDPSSHDCDMVGEVELELDQLLGEGDALREIDGLPRFETVDDDDRADCCCPRCSNASYRKKCEAEMQGMTEQQKTIYKRDVVGFWGGLDILEP